VTTNTAGGRSLFQTERMALLFIDVLRQYMKAHRFTVHDFVVMRDHVHLLISVTDEMSVEKAVQLIKGGFSYRAGKELNFPGAIWQRGFSEVRVVSPESFCAHRQYIYENPVRAGMVNDASEYPYCSLYLKKQKRAAAKAAH